MSHVTHVNKSCHTCVMTHIQVSHSTHTQCHTYNSGGDSSHGTHESCHARVTSHIKISHAAHIQYLCTTAAAMAASAHEEADKRDEDEEQKEMAKALMVCLCMYVCVCVCVCVGGCARSRALTHISHFLSPYFSLSHTHSPSLTPTLPLSPSLSLIWRVCCHKHFDFSVL